MRRPVWNVASPCGTLTLTQPLTDMDTKHPEELPDDVLMSLGFIKKKHSDSAEETWTHMRSKGIFYHHILDPYSVMDILIEIGHEEFREEALYTLKLLEIDQPTTP
jgi:hypothetical protein